MILQKRRPHHKSMKFKATDNINLRSGPGVDSLKIGNIPAGTVIESDEYSWKAVTLPDGKKGFCAATYLQPIQETPATPTKSIWHTPIRSDKFVKCTRPFLEFNDVDYPKTKHHPGVDYGTKGEADVPLYFCADGEIIESGLDPKFLGNYFFFYVPEVDRTFAYFHLRDTAPVKGQYKTGVQCGIAGQTGYSKGIHLHLECLRGRKTSVNRISLYSSKEALMSAAEDADAFIKVRL